MPVAAPALIAFAVAAGLDYINRAAPEHHAGKAARSGRPGGTSSPSAASLMSKDRPLPRYLVGVRRSGSAVVVRDVRTLAPVATVAAPAKRRFQQVAAAGIGPDGVGLAGAGSSSAEPGGAGSDGAGSDGAGSYVVSASAGGGIAFYRLRVGGDGRPGPLTPLPRLWIPGTSTRWSDMAVNARGDAIAYVSYGRAPKKIAIDVISTTGAPRRTWTTAHAGRIGDLSWAGRTLAFVWTPMRGTAVLRHQLRTLDTASRPGDLGVSKPVLTLPDGAEAAVLSRDGTTVVTGIAGSSGLELAAYSAADGRRTAVLWRSPGAAPAPRVVQLVPDSGGGDLIAEAADGGLLVGPAHGRTGFAAAADLVDVAW